MNSIKKGNEGRIDDTEAPREKLAGGERPEPLAPGPSEEWPRSRRFTKPSLLRSVKTTFSTHSYVEDD